MRFVRRRAALWMVSLAVLAAVGCGLSFGVDELTASDAGSDTSPPDRPDGTLPDGALPDGALPDGAPIDDELIDDDASFPPSNIDAATGSFVLDAGTSLGPATEILALQPGTITVTAGDGGTIEIPKEHVVYDSDCACLVVSIKDWTVPSGVTVSIVQDIPLLFVASGEVRIDGTIVARSLLAAKTKSDGNPSFGPFSGAGGGGSVTAGGTGGPGMGGANAKSDGGAPYTFGPRPWLGGHGGDTQSPDDTVPCGRGGVGGGGLQIYARSLRVGKGAIVSVAGAGAERTCFTGFGGAGGGAGGSVFVEGRLVRIAGAVLATGGGGAGGGLGDGGARGGTSGGLGGAGAGAGGDGGHGGDDTPPGDGGAGNRGGGGGGAAGGVFLRGLNVRTDAGTFAPQAKAP